MTDRTRRAVDQAIEVIRRRVDSRGTTEPSIQRQGADRILVQVPGLQDPQRLEGACSARPRSSSSACSRDSPSGDVELLPSKDEGGAARARRAPGHGRRRRPHRRPARLRPADPRADRQLQVQPEGRPALRPGDDGECRPAAGHRARQRGDLGARASNTPITGGSGQISGNFTVQQANDLSVLLRAGALPAKLTVVERRAVGPGLGRDSIEAGKLRDLRRRRPRRRLHVRDLRRVRLLRQHRAPRPCRPDLRPDVGAGGDPDAAGHRRHRAHHRHGGGFERADLRAHPRGGPGPGAPSSRRSRPASTGPSRPSSIRTRPWRSPP